MKKIFLVLLCSLTILSANVWAEWEKYEYFDNSGGLNDAFSPIAIGDNEAADLQNVVFTTSGNWKTRDGTDAITDVTVTSPTTSSGPTVSCTGLKYYRPTSGTRYLIGVFDNDTIKKMDYNSNGLDGFWDDITGSISFNAGQDDLASFAVGQDTLIIEDGINTTPPYKWSGSGVVTALGGSPPNAKIIAYHKQMAFAAGNNSNPSTLYFSDVGNIENWTTGLSGNISVETNDGSVIRALVPGFDALYIFKDKSIWRLTGNDKDTFVLQRMVSDLGVLSPNAVGFIANEFIFAAQNGEYYIYDGSIGVKLISIKIDGTIDNLNTNRIPYISSVIFNDDYYASVSTIGSAQHNRILIYDTFNKAWSKFIGISANAVTVADDGIGGQIILFGGYNGKVYQYPSGLTDDGGTITTTYLTKQYRFPIQGKSTLKDFELLRVFANQKGNYNLTVEVRKDFESVGASNSINLLGTSSIFGSAVYGTDRYGGQNLIIGRIEQGQVNRDSADFYQLYFSATQPIEVKGWQVWVERQDRQ